MRKLSDFVLGYLECALWSSTEVNDDGDDIPLDDNFGIEDIEPESVDEAILECERFEALNAEDLKATEASDTRNGHDFWLTRNRHGAGFWDRGYGAVGERLAQAAHSYGSKDAMATNEGKVEII